MKFTLCLLNKIILLLCLSCLKNAHAQLGFCTGNSGDPIFNETFGTGSNFGNFPVGSSSNYNHIYGQPQNGDYTISSSIYGWFNWFNIADHTPNDTDGRMLIVNAGRSPGEFFKISVSGLCENTNYEFSSWLINLLPASYSDCGYGAGPKPINVSFEIWDSNNKIKIKSGNTGNIYGSSKPNWEQYALLFKTRPGQTSVILKIRNNGVGGCGNDLALDDIVFKPCGDLVIIENPSKQQSIALPNTDLPYTTKLSAKPDYSVFSSHAYQWQYSTDTINWIDIQDETNQTYNTAPIHKTSYYRVKVAETANNLLNSLCHSNSEYFEVKIVASKTPIKKLKINRKPQSKVKKEQDPKLIALTIAKPLAAQKQITIKKSPSTGRPVNTYKTIIIVKNGLKIITKKIWYVSAVGKFVQTGEEITKQGNVNGITIVDETIYYKSVHGYNSIKRRYTTKTVKVKNE
ncbi:hypothetical protein ACFFVB_14005 [Formosa undariae]|uniref:Uncharacterized protein n=1 Tax=Formosa undariae TaxID=1325436 RepID=A0ABV5F418_9FLAO